jgi:hypothetical protein
VLSTENLPVITLLPTDDGSERLILVAGTLLTGSTLDLTFFTRVSELLLLLSAITSAFFTKRAEVNRSATDTFVATTALGELSVTLAPLTAASPLTAVSPLTSVSLAVGFNDLARVPEGLVPRRTTLLVDLALLVVAFDDLEPEDLDFKALLLH